MFLRRCGPKRVRRIRQARNYDWYSGPFVHTYVPVPLSPFLRPSVLDFEYPYTWHYRGKQHIMVERNQIRHLRGYWLYKGLILSNWCLSIASCLRQLGYQVSTGIKRQRAPETKKQLKYKHRFSIAIISCRIIQSHVKVDNSHASNEHRGVRAC